MAEDVSGMLPGKVMLVTGGASGIGFATAKLALYEGASVLICDRDFEGGRRSMKELAHYGKRVLFAAMDVTDEVQVQTGVERCVDEFGRLDCAFNNAGISTEPGSTQQRKAGDIPQEAWDTVLAVNLTGTWRCMRHQLAHMIGRGGGAIVNNASIAGLVGLKGHAAYAASKHGMIGLTRTAAADYARAGIRVNAVCPGFVDTPLTKPAFHQPRSKGLEGVPLRRLGAPEEVAEAVVWLLSDRASFITGLALAADGGYTAL